MYEDRTQNSDPAIHEEYLVTYIIQLFPCYIMYSHVHIIAQL